MKDVTVTIWVESHSLKPFTEVTNVIAGNTAHWSEAKYYFNREEVRLSYSICQMGGWLQINIPFDIFIILEYQLKL